MILTVTAITEVGKLNRYLLLLALISSSAFANTESIPSELAKHYDEQKQVCTQAQAMIDNDDCIGAFDYLLSSNVEEKDLPDPAKMHLLLIESHACSGQVQEWDKLMLALEDIKARYQLDLEDEKKYQSIKSTIEKELNQQGNTSLSWQWLLFFLVPLLGWLLYRKRQA